MKRGIHNIVRALAGILIRCMVLPMFTLSSCMHEERSYTDVVEQETTVILSLTLPVNDTPLVRAMSSTDEEDVRTIDVLVFKDGKYAYSGKNEGLISTNGNKKTFSVKLRQGTGYDLVILANATDILASAGSSNINTDKTKAEVLGSLSMSLAAKWNAVTGSYTPFPMCSDPDNALLLNKTITEGMNIADIGLYRMVARVQVVLGSKDGVQAKSTFDLRSVQVYNRNSDGWLKCAFNNSAYVLNAKASRVEGPLVYDNSNGRTEITMESGRGISCAGEIYLFEAGNTASDLTLLTRPCLVIGGVYGSDTTPSYYRVDYSTDSKTYLDILRNHSYTVSINAIRSRGYSTADEAFRSAPVNITAEVVVWNDSNILEVVTDGQYSLGVNRKEFSFFKDAVSGESTDNKLIATTNYPNSWSVSVMNGNTVATSGWLRIQQEGGSPAYSVTVPAGTSTRNFYIQAEVNNTGSSRTGTIYVTAGRMTMVVKVTQGISPAINLKLTSGGTEVTEMIWANTDVAQRQLTVTWAPTDRQCNISSFPMSGGGFVYDPSSPFSSTTNTGGTQTYNITPKAFTTAELTANPYMDRSSNIVFTISNGETSLSKNVILRQVNYVLNTQSGFLLMDGTAQTVRVMANFQWKAELVSATGDKSGTIIQKFDHQYGGNNTTTGDPLSFTCVDYMSSYNANNPSKADVVIRFSRMSNGQWVQFKDVTVTCYAPVTVGQSNSYMINHADPKPISIPVSHISLAMGTNQTPSNGFLGSGWITNFSQLKVKVLWSDVNAFEGNDAAVVKTLAYNGATSVASGKIYVVPGTGVGSALIALYQDANGDGIYNSGDAIRWSWLIWKSNYFPYTSGTYPGTNPTANGSGTSSRWMDRNIGATTNANTTAAQTVVGFFYQWGRKDPFPSVSEWTTNFTDYLYYAAGSGLRFTQTITPNSVNLSNSVVNPTVRYYGSDYSDWYTTNGPVNHDLWGGGTGNPAFIRSDGKSVYDPCPEGYRVPKNGEWQLNGWSGFSNNGRTNTAYGGYYPGPGYRESFSESLKRDNGNYYWSATPWSTDGWYALYFNFNSTATAADINPSFNGYTLYRANGFPVRCVAIRTN